MRQACGCEVELWLRRSRLSVKWDLYKLMDQRSVTSVSVARSGLLGRRRTLYKDRDYSESKLAQCDWNKVVTIEAGTCRDVWSTLIRLA